MIEVSVSRGFGSQMRPPRRPAPGGPTLWRPRPRAYTPRTGATARATGGGRASRLPTSTALLRARSLGAERRGRDPCTSCRYGFTCTYGMHTCGEAPLSG
eukprot:scaffold78934_cov63-Phaeocystis_antarctica.AAC.1